MVTENNLGALKPSKFTPAQRYAKDSAFYVSIMKSMHFPVVVGIAS